MLRRVSLLSGFAALALIATAGLGTASATEYYRPYKPTLQVNKAPTAQSANSVAVAKGGAAISDAANSNTIVQNNFGGRLQVNAAPTAQSAKSVAVSKGGPAISSASNSNVVSQGNVK